jgi:4-diphosphocytidyl-2-C-methyl-D-erythritol kinase
MKSYAKINVGLNILNKRDDGFHNIETVFVPINLSDNIFINEAKEEILIESKNNFIPKDEKNICYKAAKLLKDCTGLDSGIIIEIEKRIPIGAGLGGGSSNGAITLKEIIQHFKLNISENEVLSIALKLGSDVPYFLKPGIAYAKGRGEILDYFDLSIPYWILTVFPSLSISTKWAYENFTEKDQPEEYDYKNILQENINRPEYLKKYISNDFEKTVFIKYPGLINIKNLFYEKGAVYASLSGSGSSLYGFFDNKISANRALEILSSRHKVFITEPEFKV